MVGKLLSLAVRLAPQSEPLRVILRTTAPHGTGNLHRFKMRRIAVCFVKQGIVLAEVFVMLEATIGDERKKRKELTAKRNLLFAQYLKNPQDTRLALEIPKNEARLVNTDSMRNCINWR